MPKLRRLAGRLLRQLRLGSGRRSGFSFRDDEAAIRFALEHPLTRNAVLQPSRHDRSRGCRSVKLGLVIATRNRPAFASANIRSVLSQDGDFVLVVSDNSERAEDRDELGDDLSRRPRSAPRLHPHAEESPRCRNPLGLGDGAGVGEDGRHPPRHSIRSKVVEAGSDPSLGGSHRGSPRSEQ